MVGLIRQLLSAPVFEDDADKTRVAGLVNGILLVALAGAVLFPVAGTIAGMKELRSVVYLLSVSLVLLALGLKLLLHRGYVRLTGVLLSFAVWVSFTVPVYVFDGIRDVTVTGYFVVVAITSLVLGGRTLLTFCVLSSLAIAGAYYAETSGLIATPFDTPPYPIDLVTLLITLNATALLSDITVRRIAEGYEHVQRNEKALQQRNRELATLYEAARAASSDLSLDVVLQTVAKQMTQALGSQGCALSLWNQERDLLEPLADYLARPGEIGSLGTTCDLNDYPTVRQVLESCQPAVIHADGLAADEADLALMKEYGIRTLLVLPWVARDRVVGLVELWNGAEKRDYTPEEIRLAQSLADQGIVAVENARLYEWTQQEIIERKRAEEALRDSEERFRQIAENSRDVFWMRDLQSLELMYMTPAYERVWGRSIENVYTDPTSWMRSIHPEDREGVAAAFERQMRGEPTENEYRIIWPDGSIRWIRDHTLPIQDEAGEAYRIVGVMEDFTERKQAGEALAGERNLLRTLIDNLPDHIYAKDTEGRFTIDNIAVARAMGVETPDKLLGKTEFDFHPQELAAQHYAEEQAIIQSGQPLVHEEELDVSQVTGKRKWILTTKVPLWNGQREIVGIVGIGHDITVRKRTEEQILRQNAILGAINEIFEEALTCENDAKVAHKFLAVAKALTGSKFGFVGEVNQAGRFDTIALSDPGWNACRMPRSDAMVMIRDMEIRSYWGKVVTDGRSLIVNDPACHPDSVGVPEGHPPIASFLGVPLREAGETIGMIALANKEGGYGLADQQAIEALSTAFVEALMRKRAEVALEIERTSLARRVAERTAELSAANAELARALRAKDDFLAIMSHELRTPLNAILGMSEGLQEQVYGPLNERQLKTLGTIERSGRHLLALINDILDVVKISTDKLELAISSISVESVCEASLQAVGEAAREKRLKVTFTTDSAVEIVRADRHRLRQILVNLLENAVKFTPEGGAIGLKVAGDMERKVVHFTVWDTGIGISEEEIGQLFQPFGQLDSRLSRHYEGTGLGLMLARRLTEMHGGCISVESEVGKGSRFTVSLPWKREEESGGVRAWQGEEDTTVPASTYSPSHTPITILLAEDNESNLNTISEYLAARGYRVVVARDGAEAIARAMETPPDVILMDIQMPGMDGLEATRRIRADAALENIPIVALTALAMPGDRERCLEAGANEYLSKPVGLKQLVNVIEARCLLNKQRKPLSLLR
jgi:PAS domain S-box-containing protein